MPTEFCECREKLPYSALRWLRVFGPRMQSGLVRCLQDRQAIRGTLTVLDMAECISTAWSMFEADVETRLEVPPPDMDAVERARKDAREGRGSTIAEILDELP